MENLLLYGFECDFLLALFNKKIIKWWDWFYSCFFFFFEFEKVNFQQVHALYISIINVIYYISYLPTDYINSW